MKDNKFTIRIFDEVGGDSAISVDDGNNVFIKIDNAISQGLSVILDFQNINLIITAFLNAAIGQLYSKYTSEDLQEKLKLENIKPEDVRLFQQVIKRAKEYFSDPEGFENSIKD
ncbi:MAG: STAS-like domain-containing protein [Bacteroidales bacterium]|jgi:hypothetical protein|nr:STAS-like domain-containing protein [Bacteroidales bacterium]